MLLASSLELSPDVFSGVVILLSEYITGLSPLNPAIIFPFSPTNIIPSRCSDFPEAIYSSGVAGLIPPSYQKRSKAGSSDCALNLNLIIQESGKATSFFTPTATLPLNAQVVVAYASALIAGEVMPRVRKSGNML